MRKERNLFGKNWTNLRAEIDRVITDKEFNKEDFRSLSIHENWREIQEKIYHTFYNHADSYKKFIGLGSNFKLKTFSTSNLANSPEFYLDKLISEDEKVWYMVNETINEKTKYWIYEGKIKNIQIIIDETGFNELYIISKKYEWLICIDHNDILIATGDIMPDKLQKLKFED